MKIKSRSILLQLAVWISFWSVLAFTGDADDKLPAFYVVMTIRVAGLAIFYNMVYHLLLPLYFNNRKKLFYLLVPVVLTGNVAVKTIFDLKWGAPEKLFISKQREIREKAHERPLVYIIVPPVILTLTLFGFAATFKGFRAFETKRKSEEEANRRRLEAEIALLKSQINPHFLLNTLNNLYALSITEPGRTPGALLKLSEMMSYILYECAQPRVPVYKDLEFIENYIDLQRLRLSPNITLETSLPAETDSSLTIEPMLMIPFIENAFKHGLSTRQPHTISISVGIKDKIINMSVINPLIRKADEIDDDKKHRGIGIANTRQRLEHSYPHAFRLQIGEMDGKHVVTLDIQLEKS